MSLAVSRDVARNAAFKDQVLSVKKLGLEAEPAAITQIQASLEGRPLTPHQRQFVRTNLVARQLPVQVQLALKNVLGAPLEDKPKLSAVDAAVVSAAAEMLLVHGGYGLGFSQSKLPFDHVYLPELMVRDDRTHYVSMSPLTAAGRPTGVRWFAHAVEPDLAGGSVSSFFLERCDEGRRTVDQTYFGPFEVELKD